MGASQYFASETSKHASICFLDAGLPPWRPSNILVSRFSIYSEYNSISEIAYTELGQMAVGVY
jgi:hypothetical protein